MAMRRVLALSRRRVLPLLADAILPADCLACGRPLRVEHRLGACLECWARLRPLLPPLCLSCGLPAPRDSDLLGPAGGRCAACVLDPPPHGGARAAVAYDDDARRFLLAAKLSGRRRLLEPLGEQLAAAVRASGLAEGCTLVVPVPAHPWRRLARGYDPAGDLARVAASRLGLPLGTRFLARRILAAPAAKRLPAVRRAKAAAAAFRALRPTRGERVLLVDDVMTTGSTAAACAIALVRAGAVEVRVAVWARTLPGSPAGPRGRRPDRRL